MLKVVEPGLYTINPQVFDIRKPAPPQTRHIQAPDKPDDLIAALRSLGLEPRKPQKRPEVKTSNGKTRHEAVIVQPQRAKDR